MKMKRVFSGVMASAIALSGASVFGASADTTIAADEGYTSGAVGAYFMSENYTARNAFGNPWGTGEPACFPNTMVGVCGGAYGFDSKATVYDSKIEGDGTYTVGFKTSGTIDTAPSDTTKGWFVDEENGVTREGAPWSILNKYEPKKEDLKGIGAVEWEKDAADTYFHVLGISTDIPVFYDKDTGKCYLDKDLKKEVVVSDISIDMCGTTYKVANENVKFEAGGDYLQISLINEWGASSLDKPYEAFPKQDGDVNITFTVKGLGTKPAPTPAPATKTDLSKKAKVTVSQKKVAFNGKARKPAVAVKVGKTTLKKGKDYTVKYKNNKKTGKATVVVTGKGNYTGSKSASFLIVPKKAAKPTLKSLCCGKVKVTVKKDKQATGYKIRYSTNKKFKKGVKTVTIKKNSTTSKTISKLTKGKKYYFQVCSFKKIGKKNYSGAYSKSKAIIVK